MKRLLSTLLALTMALALVSCGKSNPTPNTGSNKTETPSETADTKTEGNVHIGIVTGSVSQSEDDRRGAEAFRALYGEDMVKLAIYPDNFTEELETTIQTIVNLADDADMKAIIVNQSVPGTTEAFRKIKEIRPDILCIAGEAHEDLLEIGSAADLVCNNDFVARGYLIIRTAHELGCDTFVHISFPRHLAYETMSRRIAVMKAACEEFGMKFEMETAPESHLSTSAWPVLRLTSWRRSLSGPRPTARRPLTSAPTMLTPSLCSSSCCSTAATSSRPTCPLL